jgi:FkbH-like protein
MNHMWELILNKKFIFSTDSTASDLAKKYKEARSSEYLASIRTNVSISVLANFSTQYLVSSIYTSLIFNGVRPDIFEASYDQWEFELGNPDSETHRKKSDYVIVALSSTRLLLEPEKTPAELSDRIARNLLAFKERSQSEVILVMPESLREGFDQTSHFAVFVREMKSRLREKLANAIHLIDIDPLIMEFGFAAWHSKKFLISSKFCCHPNCFPLYGDYISSFIQSLIRTPVKLVIVDLDDTLWKGTVGDVGWQGVCLDKETSAYSHLLLQSYLLELKRSGVLLAICSKNSTDAAHSVFENRSEMRLKLTDFVAQKINWSPKSTNVAQILEDLNLTTSGVIFLDDSKFEREEVRSQFPDLIIPELPPANEDWCEYLSKSGWFTIAKPILNGEEKSAQYLAEIQRNEDALKHQDYSEFLRDLGLVLTPRRVCDENFDRVFELIHKTNQFNLTTRRLSRSELAELANQKDTLCYCYGLRDKYSDYGIVSVFIAERTGSEWEINTWLMSCRAMGRGVEQAVFSHFYHQVAEENAIIIGNYVKTEKNKPVSDLLDRMGFMSQPDGRKTFSVSLNVFPRADHIKTVQQTNLADSALN